MQLTPEILKDLNRLYAQFQTQLVHKFTDMMILIEDAECQSEKDRLTKELLDYRAKACRSLAQIKAFGRVRVVKDVVSWYDRAKDLIEITRKVAEDGVGRGTYADQLLLEEMHRLVTKN